LRLDGMETARAPHERIEKERDAVLKLWRRVFE
jgi:hypothetical protein